MFKKALIPILMTMGTDASAGSQLFDLKSLQHKMDNINEEIKEK